MPRRKPRLRFALRFLRWKIKIKYLLIDVRASVRTDLPIIFSRCRTLWDWKYVGSFCGILCVLGITFVQVLMAFEVARWMFASAIWLLGLKAFISGTRGTSRIAKSFVALTIAALAVAATWKSFKWVGKAEAIQFEKDRQIARQEFLLHRSDKIKNGIHFVLKLNRAYSPEELGSYKMSMEVVSPSHTLWITSYRPAKVRAFYNGTEITNQSQNVVWVRQGDDDDYATLQDATLGWPHSNTSRPEAIFFPSNNTPLQTLGDFDSEILTFWLSKDLLSKVIYISVWADEYLLLGLPMKCVASTDVYRPGWPNTMPNDLKEQWSKEHWLRLVPQNFREDRPEPPMLSFLLSFENYTPMDVRKFERLENATSVAVPNYTFCGPQ